MNFKKVLLTGHTSGIGSAIFNLLSEKNVHVEGISRSNGFDLETNFDKVLSAVVEKDPDIFINNVYVPEKQTHLLKSVYQKWKIRDKLVINICSVASLIPSEHRDYHMQYAKDKRDQRTFCAEESFRYSKEAFDMINCGLININCDYVDTKFKTRHDKRRFPNLSISEVAEVVWFTIQSFRKGVCVREINIHSTKNPKLMHDDLHKREQINA